MTKEVMGIDLGGTAIKLGRFLQDGTCLETLTTATPQPADPKAVVQAIAEGVKQLNLDHTCGAIGLGLPGPTDLPRSRFQPVRHRNIIPSRKVDGLARQTTRQI
ncbi:MAG: ROK family protein, partial [Cyanobacteria bacterium J06558_2]